MAQGIDRPRSRSVPRQWASNGTRRGGAPTQAGIGKSAAGARHIQKSSGYLFAQAAGRFHLIEDHRQQYPVSLLCETLDVSVSGYYADAQASDESTQAEKMATSPNAFKWRTMPIEGSMGVRGCMQSYKLRGSHARGIRVARLMRELELAARRPRHRTKKIGRAHV